jgi:CheY-like chemotaxis protein
VVEDEPSIRTCIADVLRDEGYEVQTASDGQQAWAALDVRLPDVIVTDLMMPNMDGWELIAACRADLRMADLPIVACSAGYGGAIPDYLDIHAFLPKPFDLVALVDVVGDVFRTA